MIEPLHEKHHAAQPFGQQNGFLFGKPAGGLFEHPNDRGGTFDELRSGFHIKDAQCTRTLSSRLGSSLRGDRNAAHGRSIETPFYLLQRGRYLTADDLSSSRSCSRGRNGS